MLDTSILAYAEGVNGEPRWSEARRMIRALPRRDVRIPAQVLGELFVVLLRRGQRTRNEARTAVMLWANGYDLVGTEPGTTLEALDLAANHRLSFWDSVILAAAAKAGCEQLLSEDMQDGFTWRGVTVRNPFAPGTAP